MTGKGRAILRGRGGGGSVEIGTKCGGHVDDREGKSHPEREKGGTKKCGDGGGNVDHMVLAEMTQL